MDGRSQSVNASAFPCKDMEGRRNFCKSGLLGNMIVSFVGRDKRYDECQIMYVESNYKKSIMKRFLGFYPFVSVSALAFHLSSVSGMLCVCEP